MTTDTIRTIIFTLITLGFVEAIIKPITVGLVQTFAPRGTAEALKLADKLIPQLLAEGRDGIELEARLRQGMTELTGDDGWSRRDLTAVWRRFDPRVLLEHQQ